MMDMQGKGDILTRLKTVKGHINGIEKMIEGDKSCEEVLLQIVAVKSSLERVGLLIFQEYARDCLLKDKLTAREVDRILDIVIKFLK